MLTTRGPEPPKFNFCQPIQMYNPGEIKGYCLISFYHRPSSNLFCKRNAITRAGFTIWHSARGSTLRWLDFFLVVTHIWQKNVAKTPKVPEVQLNVNPAPYNMVCQRNRQLCHFSFTIHLHLASFFAKKIRLKKKTAKGNAH